MNVIVAADQNWGIGKDNKLLVSIPADMKITTLFFKHFTSVFYLGHLSSFDINGANGACGCV